MGKRGPKPKPALSVVREGNPGRRPIKDSVTFVPTNLVEPSWMDYFGGSSRDMRMARSEAHKLWGRLAPALERSTGLVNEQREVLIDFVVTTLRIRQCEYRLSLEGLVLETERGFVKNPHTTIVNGYRAHWRSLIGELGLSPSAASGLARPEGADGDEDDILTG